MDDDRDPPSTHSLTNRGFGKIFHLSAFTSLQRGKLKGRQLNIQWRADMWLWLGCKPLRQDDHAVAYVKDTTIDAQLTLCCLKWLENPYCYLNQSDY